MSILYHYFLIIRPIVILAREQKINTAVENPISKEEIPAVVEFHRIG